MPPASFACPRCGWRKSWALRDGRRRCARCRFDWRPGRLPLRLSRAEWRLILYWFVRGATSADIASETGLDRKRVLRALGAVRRAMLMTNPVAPGSSRSRLVVGGRSRHATLGLYRNGALVGAEVVPDAGHETEPGRYDAVVERGRLHRVPERGERVPFGHVEAFWAFLQRHLRAKGGIRPARLTLHLAEFTWRYNHRHVTPQQQVQRLLELLQQSHRWRERDYALAVKVLSPAAARSTPRPEPGR